jgi:TatA/E family protein of Tat protein translocase
MFGLGIGEIALILFIALIFIGPKKLPELAKGLGKGMREFQNATRGITETIRNPINETKDEIVNSIKQDINPEKDETKKEVPEQKA